MMDVYQPRTTVSNKNLHISARFSEDELAQISAQSKLLGLRPSAFIRASLFLYIEKNPQIPYEHSKHVYGVNSKKEVVKNPSSFRLTEEQGETLEAYLEVTRGRKASLVRFAASLYSAVAVSELQDLEAFQPCLITQNTEVTTIALKKRHALATCRLESDVLLKLDAKAKALGLSRSQLIEKSILAALGVS